MSEDADQQQSEERRGFFRIEDEVTLHVRKVGESERNDVDGLRVTQKDNLLLANELEKMKAESRVYLRHVEKETPEIARYFSHLEMKIDLIARVLILGSDDLIQKRTQMVNISGSGMAFKSEEAYDLGDNVDVTFVLQPSYMMINTFAKVVACRQQGVVYRVAIEFEKLSDDDRDLLIRHVVKKQMVDIREHKV
jgi:hypothetical protein